MKGNNRKVDSDYTSIVYDILCMNNKLKALRVCNWGIQNFELTGMHWEMVTQNFASLQNTKP